MYTRAYRFFVAVPPLLWVAAFLMVPYGSLLIYSFWRVQSQVIVHDWNLSNYRHLWIDGVYLGVLFRSMRIAVTVAIVSLLLAFPLAYFLSFGMGRRKNLLYQLVIVPLWVSYLVRAYAWKTLLGSGGVLNSLFLAVGVIDNPLTSLLYSQSAVILTLTHIYTPFTFLSIFAAMEKIPRSLMEASADLGASPWFTFQRVVFPLAMPGAVAGFTFAFVLSMGDFLAPLLVGGPNGMMISNVVVSLFGASYNWPLGAALSCCILFVVISAISGSEYLQKRIRTGH